MSASAGTTSQAGGPGLLEAAVPLRKLKHAAGRLEPGVPAASDNAARGLRASAGLRAATAGLRASATGLGPAPAGLWAAPAAGLGRATARRTIPAYAWVRCVCAPRHPVPLPATLAFSFFAA